MPQGTRELWDQHPQGAHGIPKAEDRPEMASRKGEGHRRLLPPHDRAREKVSWPTRSRSFPATMPPRAMKSPASPGSRASTTWWMARSIRITTKPDRFALYSRVARRFHPRCAQGSDRAQDALRHRRAWASAGSKDQSAGMLAFRQAMAAPAAMPEFKGNVVAVQTAPFWSDELGAIADKHDKVKADAPPPQHRSTRTIQMLTAT